MAELLESNKIFYTPYEPKLKNRFIMEIAGIPAFTIKTAQRPQITFDEVQLEHMNVTRYVKGKGRWQTLQITLYDPIVPSASASVIEWIRLHHESATGRDGYQDFYKKNITFQVLGPVGDIINEWVIQGAFITNADFGQYDWSSDEVVEVSITVAMDYCVLNY